MQGYNVLSDEKHREVMFDFDLQLFGGGGGGKSGGKLFGQLVLGFLSAGFGFFGAGLTAITRFAMGAALFSSVWTATHRQDSYNYDGTADIQRFERSQETMTSDGDLPVVYGRRQISGNQTYHKTNSDSTTLWKHVVLCEGGIEGIESVTANDLLIPTGSQTGNTVFTIQNVKYPDAWVKKEGHTLTLYANGNTKQIYLCTKDDLQNPNASFWDYQVSMSSLISYINRMGEGWQAFPIQSTNKYPGELWDAYGEQDGQYGYAWMFWVGPNGIQVNKDPILNGLSPKQITTLAQLGAGQTMEANGWIYRCVGPEIIKVLTGYKKGYAYVNGKYQRVDIPIYEDRPVNKIYRYRKGAIDCYRNPANFQCSTVTGGTSYTFHDCTPPQNYNEVGGYPNMAWLDMTFTISNELNGNPSVSCLVKGRKVYDIRTGITAYSTNPALCLRDFLLSKRYGLGKWFTADMLDTDSWIEAADYCDEQITFLDGQGAKVTAKRYELNMVIDSKRTGLEWVQEILANFCGYLVYSGGKLKLKIEKQTPVSYKFTDDNCFDLKISPLALSETPNRYEVTIIDPLNNWSAVKCICDDYADQKERQRIVTKAVSLEGVTSQNQALRLARFYRDYNLVCPIQLSFTTGMQGMHLEPGDVVTVSYHGVFKDMPIRINEIKETNKGTFEISGRQYNDTIYGDILGGGIHWYNYSTMQTPLVGEIPEVGNLKAVVDSYVIEDGSRVNPVNITWSAPQYDFIDNYTVEYRKSGTSNWYTAGSTHECSYVFNGTLGWTYDFRVTVNNTVGRKSVGAVISAIKVTGNDSPPAPVKNVQYTCMSRSIRFTWNANDEPDLRGYNIYFGVRGVLNSVAKKHQSTFIDVPIEYADEYEFAIEAVDAIGQVSERVKCAVTLDEVPEVTGFIGVKNEDKINFYWDEIKDCNFEIRWGSSWQTSKLVAQVNSNVYTYFCPLIGTQTFLIKAYNGLGLYSRKPSQLRMDLTPVKTRNIIAEFDEKKAGWDGAKNFMYVSNGSLVKEDNVAVGEYYTELHLNKEVEARNWIEYSVENMSATYDWSSAAFEWRTAYPEWLRTYHGYDWFKATKSWLDYDYSWNTDATDYPVEVNNYLQTYKGTDDYLYCYPLNGDVGDALIAKEIEFENGRFQKGVIVKDNTYLEYRVGIPEVFKMSFNAKHSDEPDDVVTYMTLSGAYGWLRIEREGQMFYLQDSFGHSISLDVDCNKSDVLNFYIEQTEYERQITITSVAKGKKFVATDSFMPVGSFNEMRLRA